VQFTPHDRQPPKMRVSTTQGAGAGCVVLYVFNYFVTQLVNFVDELDVPALTTEVLDHVSANERIMDATD
jgi:hypothetical protein